MAQRWWVAGAGNWSDNTNHWAASSGGAPGASKPVSGDTASIDGNSGADFVLTGDESVVVRALDFAAGSSGATLSMSGGNDITAESFFVMAGTNCRIVPTDGTNFIIGSALVIDSPVNLGVNNTVGSTSDWNLHNYLGGVITGNLIMPRRWTWSNNQGAGDTRSLTFSSAPTNNATVFIPSGSGTKRMRGATSMSVSTLLVAQGVLLYTTDDGALELLIPAATSYGTVSAGATLSLESFGTRTASITLMGQAGVGGPDTFDVLGDVSISNQYGLRYGRLTGARLNAGNWIPATSSTITRSSGTSFAPLLTNGSTISFACINVAPTVSISAADGQVVISNDSRFTDISTVSLGFQFTTFGNAILVARTWEVEPSASFYGGTFSVSGGSFICTNSNAKASLSRLVLTSNSAAPSTEARAYFGTASGNAVTISSFTRSVPSLSRLYHQGLTLPQYQVAWIP